MFLLIIGASGSGKSEYAESRAAELAGRGSDTGSRESILNRKLYYAATMEPFGEEGRQRIARHQKLREGKGFCTIECYTDIKSIAVEKDATVLLECMSNLLANELYREDGMKSRKEPVTEGILRDVEELVHRCKNLVIVTNDVFGDDGIYEETVSEYIKMLGALNRQLAKRADEVVEVVYSVPVLLKERNQVV